MVFFVGKKKIVAKKAAGKGNERAKGIAALAGTAEKIFAELATIRPKILESERIERKLIEEKVALEDELASVLRKDFAEEKSILAKIKKREEKKQESLEEKISSLERIITIYEEKKSRLADAKKRKSLLEKELKRLSTQKTELYSYA